MAEVSAALNKWISACVQPDGSVYYKTFHFVRGEEEFRYPSLEAYLATKGDLSQWLQEENGVYTVTGEWVDKVVASVNFGDYESRMYFERVLRKAGVFDMLEKAGIQEKDIVNVGGLEFEYIF